MTHLPIRSQGSNNWTSLLAELRKYRPGDTIPVYHNICGQRTTYLPCQCGICNREIAA